MSSPTLSLAEISLQPARCWLNAQTLEYCTHELVCAQGASGTILGQALAFPRNSSSCSSQQIPSAAERQSHASDLSRSYRKQPGPWTTSICCQSWLKPLAGRAASGITGALHQIWKTNCSVSYPILSMGSRDNTSAGSTGHEVLQNAAHSSMTLSPGVLTARDLKWAKEIDAGCESGTRLNSAWI